MLRKIFCDFLGNMNTVHADRGYGNKAKVTTDNDILKPIRKNVDCGKYNKLRTLESALVKSKSLPRPKKEVDNLRDLGIELKSNESMPDSKRTSAKTKELSMKPLR